MIGFLSVISASAVFSNSVVVDYPEAVDAVISDYGPYPKSVGYTFFEPSNSLEIFKLSGSAGRWDTPYPYAESGKQALGLEPYGFSSFYVDVDVNNGGAASFRVSVQTYDTFKFDYFDVDVLPLDVPNASWIPLVRKLGGTIWRERGTYWRSSSNSIFVSLDEWRNQRVRFVFSMKQDGWGDQSIGKVYDFKLSTCPVAELPPFDDDEAAAFEVSNRIDTVHLNAATYAGYECMKKRVAELGGTMSLSSAYRPLGYQQHLRDVWDANFVVDDMEIDKYYSDICKSIVNKIRAEYKEHGLNDQQPGNSPRAPHVNGNAIDATITNLPAGETVDSVAGFCDMERPKNLVANDPVHYQPIQ